MSHAEAYAAQRTDAWRRTCQQALMSARNYRQLWAAVEGGEKTRATMLADLLALCRIMQRECTAAGDAHAAAAADVAAAALATSNEDALARIDAFVRALLLLL
jgi:hypothetical protein